MALAVKLMLAAVVPASAGLALFTAAGRCDIAAFWAYVAINAVTVLTGVAILDPGLLQERIRPGGKQLPLRIYLVMAGLFLHLVLAGLDVGHWRHRPPELPAGLQALGLGRLTHMPAVPVPLQAVSLVAMALGMGLLLWSMVVNPFFSPVVRLQAERSHRLISSGPYAAVRHPGYAGLLLCGLASGPALGSWLAGVPVVLLLPALYVRLVGEERFLVTSLPGYPAYKKRVRYRLVPFVW